MSFRNNFKFAAIAIAMLAFAQLAYAQTAGDGKIASMSVGSSSVRWEILVPNSGGTVSIMFPDGRSVKKAFRAGASPEFDLNDKQLDSLPDGVYSYDLKLAPIISAAQKETMMKARGSDDDPEAERNLRKRPVVPTLSQAGSFALVNGSLVGPGGIEGQRLGSNSAPASLKTQLAVAAAPRISNNTAERLRNHRFSLMKPDVVNADDFIVQGSLCVGLDCVNNESFGFDTIRLKENNTRIKFDDTSTSAGFPNNDWQLTANDSASGGQNKFSIEDITGSKVPFTITAGARTNSIFVDSTGRVGFGTSTPVLDLHVSTGNTPAIRQEQTNAGGFTAQTWDIGANEANWFVRDVTGGSRLPLRIRPGAPTSSVDIAADGKVGIGTASPSRNMSVIASGGQATVQVADSSQGTTATDGFQIQQAGTDTNLLNYENGFMALFTNVTERMRITATGNVGIGTSAPDQKLSVSGDADKSAGGTSWGVFSDERLKDIKGGYARGLNAVMGLRPIRFSYKKDNALSLPSDTENIGFSAQELQKVVPEAVTRNANGYLTMHSDPILWAMVNAIQEQQKEIASLKAQVQKLRRTPRRHHK